MGARLVRNWLLRPSVDSAEILNRLDAIEELFDSSVLLEEMRASIEGIPDMERLLGKVTIGTANPRELTSLRTSFGLLPPLYSNLTDRHANRYKTLATKLDQLKDLHDLLSKAIADEPPLTLNDGGVIRDGFDADLDDIREMSRNNQKLFSSFRRTRTRPNWYHFNKGPI